MAPAKATDVHCVVNGSVADCTVKTSNGHEFTVHVTKSGAHLDGAAGRLRLLGEG